MRWAPKNKVKRAAFVKRDGRKKLFRCEECKGLHKSSDTVVDHIEPVINPKTGFTDWNEYIERMFVDEDGYQVMCKGCHDKKTKDENKERRKKRKKK